MPERTFQGGTEPRKGGGAICQQLENPKETDKIQDTCFLFDLVLVFIIKM